MTNIPIIDLCSLKEPDLSGQIQIAKELRDEIEDGAIEIEALGQQLIIRVREKGAFPSGSAFLQPRFRPVITKVATILVDIPGSITVSGHTDAEPVQSELYRSNWDLSAQRAVSVAHEMIKVQGITDKKMSIVGYAGTKPLSNGKSEVVVSDGKIIKISKDKNGIISKEVLTKKWSDWVDYWSVDFDFENRKELIRVQSEESDEWKELWTGDYIFDNEWQSFRTKENRELELITPPKEVTSQRTKVAVKVVDIFGNDTMKIIDVKLK